MEQTLRFKAFPILIAAIALLPSAVLAQQFTPQQMLDAMTKSPENRDVRVHDGPPEIIPYKPPSEIPKGVEAPWHVHPKGVEAPWHGHPGRHRPGGYPDGRRIPGRI